MPNPALFDDSILAFRGAQQTFSCLGRQETWLAFENRTAATRILRRAEKDLTQEIGDPSPGPLVAFCDAVHFHVGGQNCLIWKD